MFAVYCHSRAIEIYPRHRFIISNLTTTLTFTLNADVNPGSVPLSSRRPAMFSVPCVVIHSKPSGRLLPVLSCVFSFV